MAVEGEVTVVKVRGDSGQVEVRKRLARRVSSKSLLRSKLRMDAGIEVERECHRILTAAPHAITLLDYRESDKVRK